ncbi:cytosolic factor, phosphatidylinositol/phosphatidylcholine transfer protein [Clydaea vesicula]|uniref:Cytosolic factor, phosphatidylinositol/phosphatidylcholine transfer protein n=1 Tax=Clydaea vesicula TaxID=447962 RepID=A0AAD5XX42_9FUNG|nr:cytosolic factor, phosphatidylinositol/phosphatidylcholine transfer protein [Clydaea vesicula]KAJ3376868.1 cytosolic factor, phosphatidylinositol/phosphatidylcholine transfer protein [Lobulomyces angularis]
MSTALDQYPTFGRLGHLTEDQQQQLTEFKTLLTTLNIYDSEKYDDNLLLRFLRARKFNLEDTKVMFENYHNWRCEFGVDKLISEFEFPEYPVVKKYYPRYYHKCDKLGRPVYYELVGEIDVTQLFKVTTVERMIQNHVLEYEKLVNYRLPACSKKVGRYLEQSTTILDLKGVSISSFSSVYNIVKQISAISSNYYPEMMGKMYIINSPFLFTTVWALVKPLLDEVTVNKIHILGYSFKDKLLESIDAENLPKVYGGNCECEKGCQNSDLGPWNDGSVEGYPKKEFERFNIQFDMGQSQKFKE